MLSKRAASFLVLLTFYKGPFCRLRCCRFDHPGCSYGGGLIVVRYGAAPQ
jgi:hypothetical protein